MANALDSLLSQVQDAELARRLKAEIEARSAGLGLVWEHHDPETVDLHSLPVAKGRHVRLLPPRGVNVEKLAKTAKGRTQIDPMWGRLGRVADIDEASPGATRMARVVLDGAGGASVEWDADDLVCVAGGDEPIYPVLTKTGEVRRGGDDDPEHAVINAENYHALQLLARTHTGKIDAIYIDPPYNTGGARDWKYNNDFFDRKDRFRHSKWLAFMERRLKLAKELLNPEDSVLIVTIDEKEVQRLGLLLEQVFPEARVQMISININPRGVPRRSEMSRVNEFVYYVYLGSACPVPQPVSRVSAKALQTTGGDGAVTQWRSLRRTGTNPERSHSPGCYYPVYVDPIAMKIAKVGEAIPAGSSAGPEIPGLVQVLPIGKADGREKRWQMTPANLRALIEQGYAKVGSYDSKADRYSILYLGRAQRARIASGDLVVVGQDANGVKDVREQRPIRMMPKTVWSENAHDAGTYGTQMIRYLLGDKRFTFPKSLYAVEDTLRVVLENKPNAVVLDFFAGSGTTAHAVMRLNRQDGGKRRSISVTNNEVSAAEQAALIEQGLRPGDPEWEALGIANHVTKPRVAAAITGHVCGDTAGPKVKGKYKFTDEFDMADGIEANASFWTMNYLDPAHVEEDNFEILGGK